MNPKKVLTKRDLIMKYQKELDKMIVMDDYDAGKAHCMSVVIEDLKGSVCSEIEKELDY